MRGSPPEMNTSGDKKRNSNTGEPANTSAAGRRIELLNNRIDSQALFVETREVVITHGEETYRLRLTAQNKLILTK
jgi:hemin uptake protein HemP